MKLSASLIAAALTLAASAGPALAQPDVPECGTTGPALWFWWKHNPHQFDRVLQISDLRPGEFIGAIDFDPETGTLWGAGNHGGIYTLDMATGAASFRGSCGFDLDFPCGNDLKFRKKPKPGDPPPPPPEWDFILQDGRILQISIDAAGVGAQITPGLRFPASSQYAGVTPRITGVASVPATGRSADAWDIYAYDAATCGIYKVDELARMLLDIDQGIHPGCWPPDGGPLWGMDAVMDGPRPHPWLEFLVPMNPQIPSGLLTTFDLNQPGAQMMPLGLVGDGGIRFYDMTALQDPISVCAADLNGDGLVDFTDYLEFLNLYDSQDPRADFNGDGLVDFSDYLEFLNEYDAGC